MTSPALQFAASLVILARLPESRAAATGAQAREALAGLMDPLIAQAGADMAQAIKLTLDHVTIVMKNNPGKSLAAILARPDVRQAMEWPFEQADERLKALAAQAFDLASAAGKIQAAAELDALKVPHAVGGQTNTKALQLVQRDITKNTRRARTLLVGRMNKYSAANKDPLEALRLGLEDLQRRAMLGVAAAGKEAWNAAKEDTYGTAGEGIGKKWITHFIPTTCSFCTSKHGEVLPLGLAFEAPEQYQWLGPLYAPPSHPHCGCEIVPWPLD